MTLQRARLQHQRAAIGVVVLGVVLTTALVALFDESVGRVVGFGLASTVLWFPLYWCVEVRRETPRIDAELVAPPTDDEPVGLGLDWRDIAIVVVVGVALAWFAHLIDVTGAIIPGQSFGMAAANVAGAVAVARWERRHGREVLVARGDDREERLYAR